MIAEIEGMKDGEVCIHPLYEFVETRQSFPAERDKPQFLQERVQGELKKVGTLLHTEKCEMAGIRIS